MKKLKIELLMSAMYQTGFDIGYRSHVHSDLLIINQCDHNGYQEIEVEGYTWRMISTTERGLSKSRNMALKHAKGQLCLFCDDDEILAENYCKIIERAYEELSGPAAIVFNVDRINFRMKKTYYKIEKVRPAPIWRAYGSVMLVIDIRQIKKHGIKFNERFGSGTEWGGGEDCLFEYEILQNKLKMYEYPAVIAQIDYANGSAWFNGYSEKYFYNLGAFVQCRYRSPLLRKARELYTCYRLRKEKRLSVLEKMRWMGFGEKGIITNVTYSEFLENRK